MFKSIGPAVAIMLCAGAGVASASQTPAVNPLTPRDLAEIGLIADRGADTALPR